MVLLKIEPDPVPPPLADVTFIVTTLGDTLLTIVFKLAVAEGGAPRVTPVLLDGQELFTAA